MYWARMRRTTSLLISTSNVKAICCAIRGQPKRGLRRLISSTVAISSLEGPLGAKATAPLVRKEKVILQLRQGSMASEQRAGLYARRDLGDALRVEQTRPERIIAYRVPTISPWTFTLTSMREPSRLMIAMRRSIVNRARLALRMREKSAAAIPVRASALREHLDAFPFASPPYTSHRRQRRRQLVQPDSFHILCHRIALAARIH